MRKVDHFSPVPLYEQLAAILRDAISSGELGKREELPSETALMQENEVSRGTVRRALGILRDDKLIVTLPGRSSYVK
jgi:GntR family transcriptional regulator